MSLCERCRKNEAAPVHLCPYLEDIEGDAETLCDCCDECARECSDDI